MLFSTITFTFYFLPLFLIVYSLLPDKNQIRNIWFLFGSLAFYYWGEQSYILLILASILLNYSFALLIDKYKSAIYLVTGVVLNLSLLIYFKYSKFIFNSLPFIDQLQDTSIVKHIDSIYLPLGISFFTFQGVAYLIDVHKQNIKADKNIINIASYIAMFPQLIAGPIVRYQTVVLALNNRQVNYRKIFWGICLFIIGLSYKIILADNLAEPVDRIFNLPIKQITTPLSWFGSIAYSFQIYFDFCGYSTMAIGLGFILGFKFPVNFNFPYKATSLTEFWRRWHITLSSWFRDYLYIPLGGNKKGNIRTYFNLIIVFIICGFWHGASWKFLVWGLFHGTFLIIERLGFKRILDKIPSFISNVYTLFIVLISWIIFRSKSLDQSFAMIKSLLGFNPEAKIKYWNLAEFLSPFIFLIMCFSLLLCFPLANKIFFSDDYKTKSIAFSDDLPIIKFQYVFYTGILILFFICIMFMNSQSYAPFIYFRF